MFLGPRDTSDLILMVTFTFAMRRHLIRLASAPFASFRLSKFGWVPFADLRMQRLAANQNIEFTEGARKLRSFFYLFADLSLYLFQEILGQCRRPLVFPKAFAHLSTSRFV